MSLQIAAARTLHAPEAPHSTRALRALPVSARRRPRLAYGLVAVAGVLAIVGAQMALAVMTTQSSYDLADLTMTQRQLTWQRQILTDEVAGLSSPQYLAANAAAAGMVIDQSPSYLRLSDGALLGPGGVTPGISSVDPLQRGSVANRLIASTPLVTNPLATIAGVRTPKTDLGTPQAVTDGLPSVRTH